MRKVQCSLIFLMMALLATTGAWAYTATIDDTTLGANTFWGGTVVGYSNVDVIGSPRFDVNSMKIDIVDNTMTITLQGPYFTNLNGADTKLQQFGGPGDLYINKDGWNSALGTAADHYATDTFTLGEGWDYVVGQLSSTAGFGVYSLDAGFTSTGSAGYWSGYRKDQAWTGGFGALVTGASRTTSNDTMVYTIPDISGLNLGSTIGFHWTMECGNDVVEGSVSMVPEPGTMLLLGIGLLGLFGVARRRVKK